MSNRPVTILLYLMVLISFLWLAARAGGQDHRHAFGDGQLRAAFAAGVAGGTGGQGG